MECLWFSRGRSLNIRLSIPDYCRTKPGSFHFLCAGRTGPQGTSTFSDGSWISCRFTGQYTTESQKGKEGRPPCKKLRMCLEHAAECDKHEYKNDPSSFIYRLFAAAPAARRERSRPWGGAASICRRRCAPACAPVRRGRCRWPSRPAWSIAG